MQKSYNGPMRIAHRGVVQAAPENTLGAFNAALQAGFEGLEIDVQLSRDGEVVVVHDDNLTKLTLGHPNKFTNALIADLDWEELSRIEIPYANHLLDVDLPEKPEDEFLATLPQRLMGQEHGRSYVEALKQEPRMASLMRLEEFLRWLEGAPGILAEIEIKAGGAVKKILDLLDATSAADRCIMFSGTPEYIQEIQQVTKQEGQPRGVKLAANVRWLNEEAKKKIAGMDLYEVGLNANHIREEDLLWLDQRGIKVFSNLGDYPDWWRELCRLNILGFKTNYAEAYTRWWSLESLKV
ncbi:putative phosphodiesterase [Treponema primitia ZAS-2]|uniref:Putative phosphodiesterase n=1 Tax=Treponema primitia (strain ATCC BAA-887 / DSM 12427 / ZAS-2) TaxID=545694 RepID=F5YNA7_TREPZ|nr:glycerophosphodiester phosphodiesterase [Treponema primitia]AEF85753.1 putative phosphodiesterase [Treponema primitia ZAS-2]